MYINAIFRELFCVLIIQYNTIGVDFVLQYLRLRKQEQLKQIVQIQVNQPEYFSNADETINYRKRKNDYSELKSKMRRVEEVQQQTQPQYFSLDNQQCIGQIICHGTMARQSNTQNGDWINFLAEGV